MNEIFAKIGFIIGMVDLLSYAISDLMYRQEIGLYRWIFTGVLTLLFGIQIWKNKKGLE